MACNKEHSRFQNGPHTISELRELSPNNCANGNVVIFLSFDIGDTTVDTMADKHIQEIVAMWGRSEQGVWCEEHVISGIKLDTITQVSNAVMKVIVYGKLDSIDEMFYKLKWSK